MAKLDLDWLNVFIEVYKTQSVSRAAQMPSIEQASASMVLDKLRKHFDDPLFCRGRPRANLACARPNWAGR